MFRLRAAKLAAFAALCLFAAAPAQATPIDRAQTVARLCDADSASPVSALRGLLDAVPGASQPDREWAFTVVQAFTARNLRCGEAKAVLVLPSGAVNAATLAAAPLPENARSPLPSLRARIVLDQASSALKLFVAPLAADRLDAVRRLSRRMNDLPPNLPEAALRQERDPEVIAALKAMAVESGLHSPDIARRLDAIQAMGDNARARTEAELAALRSDPAYGNDPRIAAALDQSLASVRLWLHVGDVLALLYNGLSAGSVLFMSAAGLAVIFGLMGVINLAQGEFIMIGAYTTFCVQQALLAWVPGWVAWYPLAAIPVVFATTALVGVLIELTVIRHLYRRPLMTLLATWATSLLLINLVRVGFGTQNLQFLTPPYLTGGVRVVGEFLVTWNHLFAIVFAVLAFGATLALLRLTDLGLFIRAVTQNRAMAGCVGVSTRRVDMAAFGFGAGLAGLGGLALSPIYNVNPSMGTGFIIDSFMVVVLGGVGSLLGAAVASLGIGLVDVGIEPFYGAVAAKVVALTLVILTIQWRPEGLVPAKGRR